MKEKLITIKPYLNKQLAPSTVDKEALPLYYQITFERKNTQIKSYFGRYLPSLGQLPTADLHLIAFETKMLRKTIRFEKLRLKNDFSLTGIKSVYELYIHPVDKIFQQYLKKKLVKTIAYTNSEFQSILRFDGFDAHFLLLLKGSKLLIDNLNKYMDESFKTEIDAYKAFNKLGLDHLSDYNYLTLIDWLDGESEIEVKRRLHTYFKEDKTVTTSTFLLLNSIIEDRIKFL